MASLDSKLLKKIRTADKMDVKRRELPSIGLSRSMRGGLRYGAQHMFWGNRSSGKSLMALLLIAEAQQEGESCALVDVEGAYDPEWGERLGIDNSKLILIDNQKTHAQVTDIVKDLMLAGVDVVVIDSISALIPGSYVTKEGELKDFQDTGQIGQFSKDTGKMCTTFNIVNENTLLILISQVTTGIYTWGAQEEPQGGKKAMHMNTTSIKFSSSLVEKFQITGKVHVGDKVYTKMIGRPVTWKIDKDRGPNMGLSGTYNLYYDGDFIGIDTTAEMIDVAVAEGIIRQSGAWFYYGDDKWQGKEKLVKAFKEKPELFSEIRAKVLE